MKQLPDTVPESRVGRWCHWGAWIIALIGALQLLILIVQNNPVLPILGVISGTIFSFLILYAVGTLVTHTLGQKPRSLAAPANQPATPPVGAPPQAAPAATPAGPGQGQQV